MGAVDQAWQQPVLTGRHVHRPANGGTIGVRDKATGETFAVTRSSPSGASWPTRLIPLAIRTEIGGLPLPLAGATPDNSGRAAAAAAEIEEWL
jgi:hypothetical protein